MPRSLMAAKENIRIVGVVGQFDHGRLTLIDSIRHPSVPLPCQSGVGRATSSDDPPPRSVRPTVVPLCIEINNSDLITNETQQANAEETAESNTAALVNAPPPSHDVEPLSQKTPFLVHLLLESDHWSTDEHVNFLSHVPIADGVIVVVDCIEGVAVSYLGQVLLPVLSQRIRPVLFMNKGQRR